MDAKIDIKTIEKIAELSRLEITGKEAEEFAKHFTLILGHFKEIEKVRTEGVAPMVTPSEIIEHRREDKSAKTITRDDALKNAPEKSGYLFKVPPVVGG